MSGNWPQPGQPYQDPKLAPNVQQPVTPRPFNALTSYPVAPPSNPITGTFIANGTTAVTIAALGVTLNSVIVSSVNTPGGTVGNTPQVGTITPGVSFTVIASALDTSTYTVAIINN